MSVLVVGAGPTGLMLAIWLKTLRPTIELRVVDKALGPGTTSRAIIIHARTLEYYNQLGIAERIINRGKVLEGVDMVSDGTTKGTLKFGNIGGDSTKFPYVLALPQDEHERLLIEYLRELGTDVEWNMEVTALAQTDGVVRTTFDNGETIEPDYVAACDGSHSKVRKELDVAMEGSRYAARFFVADTVVPSESPVNRLRLCLSSAAFSVCLPLGVAPDSQHIVRVLGVVPEDYDEQQGFESFRRRVEAASGYTFEEVRWFRTYDVHHRVASKFRDRRVFLLGDAAHVHSPVGGQGMNTGLGDASNLAWKLISVLENSKEEILNSYEEERRTFAQKLVNSTDVVFHWVIRKGILGFLFRKVFMANIVPLLWKLPFVPRKFFKTVSQLGITYRDSSMSQGQNYGNLGDLQAGDRLPYTGAAGVDNHEVLQERRFQIHRYGGKQKNVTVVNQLPVRFFDVNEPLRYGLNSAFDYLVRPDGYISSITPR